MELLTNLGGYYLIERGKVSIKGKGNQQTYWLLGEDPAMRRIRKFEREKRISNGHIGPKSSLKYKGGIIKSPVIRCSSLESPKKLRFASSGSFDTKIKRKTLDVIQDNSPYKKSASSLIENPIEVCQETLKSASCSCPCIENLASSSIMLAQSHLSMFLKDDKSGLINQHSCRSVPTLCSNLTVPRTSLIQVISAPVSPKARDARECEELFTWNDSTPLLRITQADNGNSCI